MTAFWQNFFFFLRATPHLLPYCSPARWPAKGADEPGGNFQVPGDFFGVCVAANDDPSGDDFIIERLKELALRHVRLDLSSGSRKPIQQRFLRRLLDEKFRVGLHLVQPIHEARKMCASDKTQDSWREFLAEIFSAYGREVDLVEIGSTCNRRKWSGYSLPGYLMAWRIAREMAEATNCPLGAPNATDFEPFYNIAILNAMQRLGILPAAHTNNLFVERAVEPEAYDHKIMGKFMADKLRFNLIRKARFLNDIGRDFGVRQTICSHVSWSLRRIHRLLEDTEEKQADYLARYCCLAAAGGALARVYWGPLIGQREGLIDDGTTEFPEIPHVTYYGHSRGNIKNYRIRPAFQAFRAVNCFLAGAKYVRKISSAYGLEIHEFHSPAGVLHVAWTMNGKRALMRECYCREILPQAEFFSRDGAPLAPAPLMISESPLYILWPGKNRLSDDLAPQSSRAGGLRPLAGVRFACLAERHYDFLSRDSFSGVGLSGSEGTMTRLFAALKTNGDAGGMNGAFILRNARNRVWRIMSGDDKGMAIVVKQFKPLSPARRFFAGYKGDKALRSWNGANELLRRGIPTPLPAAFFHHTEKPLANESWYVCEEFAGGFSVREAFTAFSRGAVTFKGEPADALYGQIAFFIRKMHDRGVYFRDLSAGNLLFRLQAGHAATFSLIDTARAVFFDKGICLRQRLCDLMRICHPLDWNGRRAFLTKYMALIGRRYQSWMNIVFHYYDFKHWVKRHLRRRRG